MKNLAFAWNSLFGSVKNRMAAAINILMMSSISSLPIIYIVLEKITLRSHLDQSTSYG